MTELQPQKLVRDNDAYGESIASGVHVKHDLDHTLCFHCGSEIPVYRIETGFCCNGCKFVYQLIRGENLEKFYQLTSGKKLQPKIQFFKRAQNLDWMDSIKTEDVSVCEFSIEGIECAACVWLMKTLAKRMDITGIEVNSALGRIRIRTRGMVSEKLKAYFSHLQDFGYRVFPLEDNVRENRESRELLVRIGILGASVMNSMMFSFAMYLGLTVKEPFLFHLFSHLNFLFCTLAVGVGGSYFFRKAWAGLKMRIFHFDLPVSIGILAAYFGSTFSYFFGNEEHVYFDTLCTFIFLMVLGRFLQVRWVEKNRASISSAKELDAMKVKKIGETLIEIPLDQIQSGDRLVIASGGLIPILCVLESPDRIEVSQEWITGESDPVEILKGQMISAGSQNISMQSLIVKANQSYKSGDVCQWMFSAHEKIGTSSFWQTYAQKYSWMVFGFLSFGFFFFAFSDLERAIKTAITISLVTCPCGIGIGIPMAQMVAQRKLLGLGIYLRDLNLLEHLKKIKTLVFDKTGTLTLSDLRINNPQNIDKLDKNQKSILFHAVAQSQHPVSQSIYHFLITETFSWKEVSVREIPGRGLDVECDGEKYFIGRSEMNKGLSFSKGENVLLELEFEETLLEDAKNVFGHLQNAEYGIKILSGDKEQKVFEIAQRLGLNQNQYFAQCTPKQKEEWIQKNHPENILFLGDGLNDSLALRSALISGASLSNSVSLASNANFYFSTLDIRWLPKMLLLGRSFSSVVRGNVIFSIFYNCTAVILSMVGVLTPLVAAIVMPTVSLLVVGVSTHAMKKVK